MGGTFTLRRILGTVPVEPDGSASFEVPPLRAVYFVALDEKGLAVKRMQSFTMVMPGETQGCVGCHEARTGTASRPAGSGALMALKRPPSRIEPIPGVPEVIDYPRDIQPIWDRHCVTCHSAEKPSGRVVLTGDYNEWFTQSYYALFAYDQISDVRNWAEDGNNPPWGFGTGASPLMKKIDGSHYDVKLTRAGTRPGAAVDRIERGFRGDVRRVSTAWRTRLRTPWTLRRSRWENPSARSSRNVA